MSRSWWYPAVRDPAVLFLHLLATVARLARLGGARAVVAESVLVKTQLLIRNRSPNLRSADRVVAGLCAFFIRPGLLIRSAIVFTIDAVEPASRADSAEVSSAVLVESTNEAQPQAARTSLLPSST